MKRLAIEEAHVTHREAELMIKTASHRLNEDMFCGLSSGSRTTRCVSPSAFCEVDMLVSVVAASWGWSNDADIFVNIDMVRHKPEGHLVYKENVISRCEADD
jgi:hypothetical protein